MLKSGHTNEPIITARDVYNNDKLVVSADGSVRFFGTVYHYLTPVHSSDRRLKKEIQPLEKALEKVTQLQGVSYKWKDESKSQETQIGVIAQEVEKVFPEVVLTDDEGMKSVAYQNLVAPLIEAVKELKKENDDLKARLAAIEAKLAEE